MEKYQNEGSDMLTDNLARSVFPLTICACEHIRDGVCQSFAASLAALARQSVAGSMRLSSWWIAHGFTNPTNHTASENDILGA